MKTFQGNQAPKQKPNTSNDSKSKNINAQKNPQTSKDKDKNNTNKNKINNKTITNSNKTKETNTNSNTNKPINKPKLSQEVIYANLALIGEHPKMQNLTEVDKNNDNKEKNKNNKLKINTSNNNNTNNTNNNKNNKKYSEPYKPIGQYIIDKTLRFEENKSKKNIKSNKNKDNTTNNTNNKDEINNKNEFNSDEEDELIKSKRKKINISLNKSKKKNSINKIRPGKSVVKDVINSIIKDNEEESNANNNNDKNKKNERKTISQENKPKIQSGNFVKLNLKKQYKEKKRMRPVNIRRITLNHSKQLYKYQKQAIKNSSTNDPYMGQGNTGLGDIDTLMKEQNDADKNDNSNLINTLVEKLPVFSQSFIEETQKTPLKAEDIKDDKNNNDKDIKGHNKDNKMDRTPMTNRLTTILKNSLQKKISLDTELKFLSQEFKYLLSGNKEKIIKLNEIKKETLLTKKTLETISEENNNKTNDNNENKTEEKTIDKNNNTKNKEMSKEEIDKMENEILLTVLKENFNLEKFSTELQLKTIKNILNKKNIFYISSPGIQQNLCYEFSSLLFDGITVVISPLLPNITQNLTYLPTCLKAAAITSFTTPSQKKEIYDAIKSRILNILYITPERFVLEKLDELKTFNISLICIENAIYSLPNSTYFRPVYINLISKIKSLLLSNEQEISLLLLSNYITNKDKVKICEMYDVQNVVEEPIVINPEINLCISKENNIKLSSLLKLIRTFPTNNNNSKNIFSVIFCNYKKTINEVTTFLNQNGINATSYHGGKDEIERQIIQSNFIKNKIKILVCTSSYSLCFIQNFIKYIIIYEMPFSIEQLLKEFNKNEGSQNTQKYVHIFLDDNNYINQRKLIFADTLERKRILTFIEYIFTDKTHIDFTNNKYKKKRNYLTSIGEPTHEDITSINLGENNKNNLSNITNINKIKCLNLNNIEEIYNIKRNIALYFLLSLAKYKSNNNGNDIGDIFEILGIGPSEITIRFFKTSPDILKEQEPLLKVILSNCKERLGGYTFNVSNICNICSISYNEILLTLFKLQEKKEISYETKEDGIFIKIKKTIEKNIFTSLLTYFYELNNNLIHEKIQKLNCVYILLRKFSVNNSSIFNNMENDNSVQIKCLDFCGSYNEYKDVLNKKIYSYFNLYDNISDINGSEINKIDDIYAGNSNEKDILLPIAKLENQRDKINFINNLKDLIKRFLQYEINISVIDVLFVIFGYMQKGKGINNYMSHPMWNKYSNYDFEQLFDIVDTELKNIKIELINEDNKQIASKKLKEK